MTDEQVAERRQATLVALTRDLMAGARLPSWQQRAERLLEKYSIELRSDTR